jgi:hypothetical protein
LDRESNETKQTWPRIKTRLTFFSVAEDRESTEGIFFKKR